MTQLATRTEAAPADTPTDTVDVHRPAAEQSTAHLSLADKLAFADALAKGNAIPRHLKGSPGDVLFAMEVAEALDVHRVTAFTSVHVVEGRPEASAELVRALILRAGHVFDVVEMTRERCTIECRRREWPTDRTETVTYTIADAQTAGLASKDVWKKHAHRMLLARATSDAAVAHFPDVKAGIDVQGDHDAFATIDGEVVPQAAVLPPTPRQSIAQKAAKVALARTEQAAVAVEVVTEQDDQRTVSDLRSAIMRAARIVGWDQADVETSFAQDHGGSIAQAPRDQLVAFAYTVEQLAAAKTEDPQ